MTRRWSVALLAVVLLAAATPAVGSFHERLGAIPDRVHLLVMSGTSFNGLHAPDAPLLEAYVGERVRFVVLSSEPHPFHLHGHPWLLADGSVVDTFLVKPDVPHAFDVPAGGVDKHAGDWMYHCHISSHMEGGMWGIFRVYPYEPQIALVEGGLVVDVDRLGKPVDGATLSLTVDGEPLRAHVMPEGKGRYVVHAAIPPAGALVLTADHPELGQSVARLGLGGTPLAPLVIGGHHAHAP